MYKKLPENPTFLDQLMITTSNLAYAGYEVMVAVVTFAAQMANDLSEFAGLVIGMVK